MDTHTEKNPHFASMKRTARETAVFVLFAAMATVATTFVAIAPAAAATPTATQAKAPALTLEQTRIARGEYLVRIGGCNDCHTPGYAEAAAKLPHDKWLVGLPVGFQGPWGVSYPSNLRLRMNEMTEEQWVASARAPRLPPMPWFALRDMTDEELRSIYAFVRSLGPAGEPMPVAVAPGQPVTTPVIVFVPQMPAVATQASR